MIENPKVGQRVMLRHWYEQGQFASGWIVGIRDQDVSVKINGYQHYVRRSQLHSPASAAATMRAEAQRLLDAAEKLEQEGSE